MPQSGPDLPVEDYAMKPTENGPFQIPVYAIIVLILGATGIFYFDNPLTSFRPTESIEKPKLMSAAVEARLWQDPISAVRRHRRESKEKDPSANSALFGDEPRILCRKIQKLLLDEGKKILILPVMVPGGSSVENYETRLRSRYAVLAALDSAGYSPSQSDRIRWVRIEQWSWKSEEETHKPLIVPYEWCEQSLLHPGAPIIVQDRVKYDKILVLWLEDWGFSDKPLDKLDNLIQTLAWNPGDGIKGDVRVLGPATSDGLKEMIQNLGPRNVEWVSQRYIEIYSPWATADPILLKSTGNGSGLIFRTIANDRSLVSKLVKEVEDRKVNLCTKDRVAIISEWDTFYGRALPLTFAACVKARCKKDISYEKALRSLRDNPEEWPQNIRRVIYLRGLDGKRSEVRPAVSTESKNKKNNRDERERPEGRSQLDYVRRLADTLHREEGRKLKAIGILGSDVYDKLLLLQALRDRFPHAIFFTTDLDARLLHPSQSEWARNLIIASSFDLTPEEMTWMRDRGPAPFRNAYQTSLYIATLEALGHICHDQRKLFSEAKLYEVGRTGAKKLKDKRGRDLLDIFKKWWLTVTLALLLFLSFIHLKLGLDGWRLGQRRASLFLYGGFFMVILVGAAFVSFKKGPPEPFALLEGISIWPSEIIRLLAAFLSFHFLVRIHKRLFTSNKQISKNFGLASKDPDTVSYSNDLWHNKWRILSNVWPGQTGDVDVNHLWQQYLRRGEPLYRWIRVALLSVLYVVFAISLFHMLDSPVVPCRGDASLWADRLVLRLSVFLLIFLIFFVVDATMLCERFIKKLGQGLPRWPPESLDIWSSSIPGVRKIPEECLNIQLIAKRTEVVGSFVLYPFIVIFLMILSRINLFDKWDWPVSLVLVLSINSICAISCAFILRRSAKEAKDTTVENLKRKRLQAEGNDTRVQQLSLIIQEIENLKRGAFARLSQQPALRAILMPFGGLGTAWLLEYFTKSI